MVNLKLIISSIIFIYGISFSNLILNIKNASIKDCDKRTDNFFGKKIGRECFILEIDWQIINNSDSVY